MASTENTPLMLQHQRRRVTDADGPSLLPKPKPVVLIDEEGRTSYTTLRKQALVTDLHLRHRDIRALDPGVALPYPSAIFVRKGALVINLEGLKLIIGRDKTLVISVPQPNDLSARTPPELGHPIVLRLAAHIAARSWPGADASLTSLPSFISLEELRAMQELPYELRTLEAALSTMVKILEGEVRALEDALAPVLRRLTRQVSRDDLETLYEKQNKLDRVQARVGRIKEILEELLDDEQEMAGMCLSRAELARQDSAAAMAAAMGGGGDTEGGGGLGGGGSGGSPPLRQRGSGGGGGGGGGSCYVETGGKCEETALDMNMGEVGECEDLMEAYWLQVDSLLSKLGILGERISNTQRLVNLDLDSKRNSLVALGLLVDLVLMCFETHMVFTGVFGMNLESGLEGFQPAALWVIAGTGLLVGVLLMLSFGSYALRKGLLYLPSYNH